MLSIIINQIIKMILILLLGVLLYRTKLIDAQANAKMADLLLLVINPIVTFCALQSDYTPALVRGLLISYALAITTHLIMVLLSSLLIRKEGNDNYAVERLSAVYSNCGFIGIPLVQSVFGAEGVLYLSAYLTVFNLFIWTHGIYQMKGSDTEKGLTAADRLKALLKNLRTPMIFACIIGLIFFFLRIRLPDLLMDTLNTIGNMNTPLAMLIAGISVAQTHPASMLKNIRLYLVSAIRLLVMPAVIFLILLIIRVDSMVACTILIASACPAAVTCTALALRYGRNNTYASELYAFSTVCSLVTIPLFIFAADRLL